MKPINFEHQTALLRPTGASYSEDVAGVEPLPVWSDGERCVSCWRLGWRERISALVFGRVWLSVLSGRTQPPACLTASRGYFEGAQD